MKRSLLAVLATSLLVAIATITWPAAPARAQYTPPSTGASAICALLTLTGDTTSSASCATATTKIGGVAASLGGALTTGSTLTTVGAFSTNAPFTTAGQGLLSGTYTSGITATGSATQTCNLTLFNNGNVGGTATVALTGTNAIAGGTALVITAAGAGNTSASTSATVGNGTATCTGPATVTTLLTGFTLTFTSVGTTNATLPSGTPSVGTNLQAMLDGTAAIKWFKADGATIVASVDTTNTSFNFGSASAPDTAGVFEINNQFKIANGTSAFRNLYIDVGYTAAHASIKNAMAWAWSSTSSSNGTIDTTLCRQNPGVVEIGSSTGCAASGTLEATGIISTGTPVTISGCATISAIVGGATAGSFSTTTTGTCTAAITINGATGLTAPHGWACFASDITAAHLVDFTQTATSATGCTVAGATTSGDTIVFHAQGY